MREIKYNRRKKQENFNYSNFQSCNLNGGFTLVETVLVIVIVAILATFASFNLYGSYQNQQLQSDAEEIAYALRGARDNSVNQKNSDEWGVHFDNAASPTGFFAVFEGANYASGKNIVRTNLSSSVIFKNPPVASSTDIIFSKMAGLPSSAASIIISLNNSSSTKAITVNSSGEISY